MPASPVLQKLYAIRLELERVIQALELIERQDAVPGECLHPTDKVVNLGTFTDPNLRLCGECGNQFHVAKAAGGQG